LKEGGRRGEEEDFHVPKGKARGGRVIAPKHPINLLDYFYDSQVRSLAWSGKESCLLGLVRKVVSSTDDAAIVVAPAPELHLGCTMM
jgi:hypothetical protein